MYFAPFPYPFTGDACYCVPREDGRRCDHADHHHRQTLAVLVMFIPAINRWLDAHLVKGNPVYEMVVEWTNAAFMTIADFTVLREHDEHGLKATHRRLKGLCPIRG